MIVAPDRYMTCIDLNSGAQLWRVKQRRVRESTGISNDGKIFYSKTMDGQMIAIPTDADSYNELWCTDVGWGYDHSFCPLIESDNIIYMSNRRGKVAAVSSSGEVVGVAKLANSAANDLRADSSRTIWASFIEGTIWRLKAK
jgi:outer membrane protein assembly factor BamB